jgi:hypothetical protein
MTHRVQIPAYCDWWMRGARYGEVVKVTRKRIKLPGKQCFAGSTEIAHVKLDSNNKVIRVLLDDCTEVG